MTFPPTAPPSAPRPPGPGLEDLLGSRSKVAIWRVLLPIRVPLSGREVARRARVTPDTANRTLNQLAGLGVLERMPGGRDVLFRVREPLAGAVKNLEHLFAAEVSRGAKLLDSLRAAARDMRPQPLSVVLFGSAARSDAGSPRDLDLFILTRNTADARALRRGADHWARRVERDTGLPVSLVVRSKHGLSSSLAREARQSGILIAGADLPGGRP